MRNINTDEDNTGAWNGTRVRLKNPQYYNQDVINTDIEDRGLPEIHPDECRQSYKSGEKDVVAAVFEYLLTQHNLKQGLKMYGEHG